MARVIVVTSGKGGVGKTTVTAGLGRAIARRGKRVVLMDADLGLNNLDVVMDVESKVVYDILDVVQNRCRPRQALIEDNVVSGLYIMPGASYDDGSRVCGQNLRAIINALNNFCDYVFIDCPAGIEVGFHRAVAAADEALVVTTAHASALRDANVASDIIKSYMLKSSLVINRARGDMIISGEQLGAEEISELLQIPVIGVLPEDDCINTNSCFLCTDKIKSDGDRAIDLLAENLINNTNKAFDVTKKYRGFFGGIKRSIKKIV